MDTENRIDRGNADQNKHVVRYDHSDGRRDVNRVTKGERSGSPGHKGGEKDSGG